MASSENVDEGRDPAMFDVMIGRMRTKKWTVGESRDLACPFDKDEEKIAERSLRTDVFDEAEYMKNTLLEIDVSHGMTAI